MVYKIYCDGNIIHNPQALIDTLVLKDVTLDMEDNTAGTLNFTILPTHQFYGEIRYFASRISVYQENVPIWRGRPTGIKPNEDLSITYTCEGMLAFFNDVLIPKVITTQLDDRRVITMFEKILDVLSLSPDALYATRATAPMVSAVYSSNAPTEYTPSEKEKKQCDLLENLLSLASTYCA